MIGQNKILGLIPARGGSKGVPRKNIRNLGGKPLIQYTIETALASKYIDRLIVSTDDNEIADIDSRIDKQFEQIGSDLKDIKDIINQIESSKIGKKIFK